MQNVPRPLSNDDAIGNYGKKQAFLRAGGEKRENVSRAKAATRQVLSLQINKRAEIAAFN
jgi:hypothetical protein